MFNSADLVMNASAMCNCTIQVALDLTAQHLLNPGVVIGPKEHNTVHLLLHCKCQYVSSSFLLREYVTPPAGRLQSVGGRQTLPGQGEKPFIFAHTGSPILRFKVDHGFLRI